MEELITSMNRLIEQNAELIKQVTASAIPSADGGIVAAVPAPIVARKTAEEILRDKISLLHQLLTKSPKVKDYKTTNDQPIKEWLIDFEDDKNDRLFQFD